MMNTSKKLTFNIPGGTILDGKWHRHRYCIIKSLGYGATGSVYLAQGRDGLVAIKLSDDSMAITSEVNVLRHFSKVQGCLGPSLLDVDDWIRPGVGKALPFYVMEYLNGVDLLEYIMDNGEEWIGVLVLQLLSDLEKLHREGWVFGDLKPDNLLVVGPPPRIRWLDVGGTTIQGRSIKEFTEFFDRGYWGLGSRKAEPSYDLFAVAMIIINTAYPKRFSKKGDIGNYLPQLIEAIQSDFSLRKFERVLLKAIQGRYHTAEEMRRDLIIVMGEQNFAEKKPTSYKKSQKRKEGKKRVSPKKRKDKTKSKGVIETVIIAIFLLLAYFLYIAGHII